MLEHGVYTPRYACSLPIFCLDVGRGDHVDDAAVLHDVVAVGDGGGEMEVLLDQQDGEAAALELADDLADALHDHRRQPLGRLVEQQQVGAGAQDAADRQHLLLAARQLGALAAPPLLQVGKELVDLGQAHAARLDHRRQQQVLLDIEAREDAALLRAVGEPQPRDLVGRHGRPSRRPSKVTEPVRLLDDAHDRLQGRGLARAVAAEQRHQLAAADLEVRRRAGCAIRRTRPAGRRPSGAMPQP